MEGIPGFRFHRGYVNGGNSYGQIYTFVKFRNSTFGSIRNIVLGQTQKYVLASG
jgi:hypothetical protein